MNEENLKTIMSLISYSGDAKSSAMEAIQFAKKKNFSEALKKLDEAKSSLVEAHRYQTQMLTEEVNGNSTEITLLLIHSQDHLMTAITFNDIATELVDLYKRV